MTTNSWVFNPPHVHALTTGAAAGPADDPSVYVFHDNIVLSVKVALATGRPLLVRGAPGTGKSSLAMHIADVLQWRYYERVITSRTQARDLLYEVDLLQRLQDAQSKSLSDDYAHYVRPGVLWWAFDSKSAARRGRPENATINDGLAEPGQGKKDAARAVVLLDEIDKADPDVPNNLLGPLGSLRFLVDETNTEVRCHEGSAPLLILTTNEERVLPKAFLRRCVELELPKPDRARLLEIGKARFPVQKGVAAALDVDGLLKALVGEAPDAELPSPAEFVDTLRAARDLRIQPTSAEWAALTKITVFKPKARREST